MLHQVRGKLTKYYLVMEEYRKILVVEDDDHFGPMVVELLELDTFRAEWQKDSRLAVEQAAIGGYAAVLLDIGMPYLDGFQLCRLLKSDPRTCDLPVIIVTGWNDVSHIVHGFKSGADDYVGKPIRQEELYARLKAHIRLADYRKQLSSLVQQLSEANSRLHELNSRLDRQVALKVSEVERLNRLRRYLSPQVAEKIVEHAESKLADHEREITVAFFDLRGFTPFCLRNPLSVTMSILREYHQAVGPAIFHHEGTLERFAGDGFMVYFGDPQPTPDHAAKAVRLAVEIMGLFRRLQTRWEQMGHTLGLGAGIASGVAFLGNIGFSHRLDYAAIGPVTNLAARLCAQARPGQILISERTRELLDNKDSSTLEPLGAISLKGFAQAEKVYAVPLPSI